MGDRIVPTLPLSFQNLRFPRLIAFLCFLWQASSIYFRWAYKLLIIFDPFQYSTNVTKNLQQIGKEKNVVFKSQNNLRIITRIALLKKKLISGLPIHRNYKLYFIFRPVEIGRGWEGGGVGLELPQIFAKVDLLTIDNNSDKKKIQTSSSSSKTTGNITLIHFM